jgi:adenylate kinase family enzyme
MKKKLLSKIHIIGSVGSGKTTLARRLSKRMNVPFYELDNVVWKRTETDDYRRTTDERDEHFRKIIHSEGWIIEGVHFEWVHESFDIADVIILLDTAYSKRTIRITKRFILQKLGFEKANYKPTFKMFRKMFVWNHFFEHESKRKILKILSTYEHKLVHLKDNTELEKKLIWRHGDV